MRNATSIALVIAISAAPAIACESVPVPQPTIKATQALICEQEWKRIEEFIRDAYGLNGSDQEGTMTAIYAERLIAALNTIDGASPEKRDSAQFFAGEVLSANATLRAMTRATMFHAAFTPAEVRRYCEYLVETASPSSSEPPADAPTPALQAFVEAVECGM